MSRGPEDTSSLREHVWEPAKAGHEGIADDLAEPSSVGEQIV